MRAALYARFSSDLQKPTSIADQLTACRRHAERMGATVVAEFTDQALTGATRAKRTGLAALVEAARAGAFDVVVAEALDRITRSGGDAWDLYEELELAGVAIHTIAQGRVEEMAVGFAGTVAALELKANALRVRRGMAGVVAAGRWPTSPPYGYRRRIEHDDRGERIKGLLAIDAAEAQVVRRACAEFVAGSSPVEIARRLTAEGVPGPRGATWEHAHLMGHRTSLRGLFRNPLYGGELVWNRQTRRKVRRTGGTQIRANPEADRVRAPVPELAIVEPALWAQVQAEVARRSDLVAAAGNPSAANAPRRLFSGLIRCGLCDGAMRTGGPGPRFKCLTRIRKGPGPDGCDNARSPLADQVEAEILDTLRRDLLHPDAVAAFVDEYRKAATQRRHAQAARRSTTEQALADVEARLARLLDQVEAGHLTGPTLTRRLAALEAEAERHRAQLAAESPTGAGAAAGGSKRHSAANVVVLAQPARYLQLIDDLRSALDRATDPAYPAGAERDAARAALRRLVPAVRLHPAAERGRVRIEILPPDFADLLGLAPAAAPSPVLSQRV